MKFTLHAALFLLLAFSIYADAAVLKTIKGVVVNDGGTPVTGASVTLLEGRENDEGYVRGNAISGIDGRFSISYRPAGPSIYNTAGHLTAVSDSGLGFMTIVNAGATQQITISPRGSITGAVKSPDGRPVQGVQIKPAIFVRNAFLGQRYMNYRSVEAALNIPPAESDSRGIFTIKGLPIGWETHLTAYIGGLPMDKPAGWIGQWSDTQPAFPEPQSDANAVRVTFISDGRFAGSGGIMGRLYDASERPMPGITVTAGRTEKGSFVKGENPTSTVTDSEGRYRFPALRPGEYAVSVFEAEQPVPVEMDVRVVKDDITEVPLYAETGTMVSGRVTDQATGKGIAGVVVASAETRPVISAKDGSFRTGMLPGEGLILADGESVGYYPLGRKIAVPETGELTNVSIKLIRVRRLYGKVVDAAGKPVDGAWIRTMWPDNPGDLYQADASGNYRIITDDRKSMTMIAADRSLKTAAIKAVKLSQNTVNMDIKVFPTASLQGTVRGVDGRAVEGAKVTPLIVFDKYRVSAIENQVYTSVSGNYRVDGFIPGARYALRVRAEGYEEVLTRDAAMPKLTGGKTASADIRLAKKD